MLPKIAPRKDDSRAVLRKKLMREEAKIGGKLFGPIPKGHRREFFCLDAHTWVWHEEWLDDLGNRQALTTRYDVRPGSVLKSVGGKSYQQLSEDEARNLYHTTELYEQSVGLFYENLLQNA